MGAHLTLAIGNKTYSSWSLRPWLALRHFGIPFEEVLVPLRQADTRERTLAYSPTGLVPALRVGAVQVWESIAILEMLAEVHPEMAFWPKDIVARAAARSMAAEMHAGFSDLRSACPMNLGKRFAARDRGAAVQANVDRITAMWRDARARFGKEGPFLCGAFGAVDAMYAPVVTRFQTYSIPVDPVSKAYMEAVLALPAYKEWLAGALGEPWTLEASEVKEPAVEDHRRAVQQRAA